jgi:hypothetical protein
LPSGTDVQRILSEVEERNGPDHEGDEHADRKQRHHDGDHERQLDAAHVEADEQDVAENPIDRLERGRRVEDRREIGADEVDDHRRRQHVFDVLGDAGDESAPWAESSAGEGVGPAGMRQRRAHFGNRIGKPEIHDGDEDGAEEHSAPAAH